MRDNVRGQVDVAVVGGGLAGLIAAGLAAREGRRVTVFERASELGGRARTETVEGFALNLGAHAIYRGGPAKAALRELDVPVSGHFVNASGSFAISGGKLHTLPSGPLSLLATSLLPAGGRFEIARFLARLTKEVERAPADEDAVGYLEARISDPAARQLLAALLRLSSYTASLRTLAAPVALRQLARAIRDGVEYVDGGWGTIVESLRARAAALGVEIQTGAPVRRVVLERGGVRGVELDGGIEVRARAVIVAASPKQAVELLPGSAGALEKACASLRPMSAACLDLALARLPKPRAAFALGIDQPLYVSVHSRVARLAPEGGAVIHALEYLGGDDSAARDAAEIEHRISGAVDLLQPGWRGLIVAKRFRPNMTVSFAAIPPVPASRPSIDAAGIRGLFLAGDWIGPTYLLADAAAESARSAAQAALQTLPALAAA